MDLPPSNPRLLRVASGTAGSPIGELPEDVIRLTMTYLSPRELLALSGTCRRLHGLASDSTIWGELLQRDFQLSGASAPPRGRAGSVLAAAAGSGLPGVAVRAGDQGGIRRVLSDGLRGLSSRLRSNSQQIQLPQPLTSVVVVSPSSSAASSNPIHSGGGSNNNINSNNNNGSLGATSRYYRILRGNGTGGGAAIAATSGESFRNALGRGAGGAVATAAGASATPLHRYRQLYRERKVDAVRREKETARLALGLRVRRKRFCLRIFLDFCQWGIGICVWPLFLIAFLVLLLNKVTATVEAGNELAAAMALISPSPSSSPSPTASFTPSPTIGGNPNLPTMTALPTPSSVVELLSPSPAAYTLVAAGPSWWTVFAPLIVFILWPCLPMLLGVFTLAMGELTKGVGRREGEGRRSCCTRLVRLLCCNLGGNESGAWVDQIDGDEHNNCASLGYLCLKSCCGSSNCCARVFNTIVNLTGFVCLVALPFSVAAKLSAGDGVGFVGVGSSTSWGVVLLPLWLALTAWCCLPCSASRMIDSSDSDVGAVVGVGFANGVLVVLTVITFAVICAILGGKDIAIKFAFVPFWIYDCLALICFTVALCMSCFASGGFCRRTVGGSRNDRWIFLATGLLGFLIFGGIGVGQAVAAGQWENGDIAGFARSIIMPILIVVVLAALLVCAMSVLAWHDARTDKSFKQLYRAKWWSTESSAQSAVPKGTAALPNVYRSALAGTGFSDLVADAANAGEAAARDYEATLGGPSAASSSSSSSYGTMNISRPSDARPAAAAAAFARGPLL